MTLPKEKRRVYLDIETTGLSRCFCELTVVGLAFESSQEHRVVQFVGRQISDVQIMEALAGAERIYTYNGSRFDLPFIKAGLGLDLKKKFVHTDLMYACWKKNLKGGLKAVEAKLGIERILKGVDGFMAVKLWYDYVNNRNTAALAVLLNYNREDVINLISLRHRLSVD